ncbi:MAG: DUF2236 domain-containing protein [Deltaproteobacteria bacterium]|nr:DUF2236 domain-containing protein [Deltaproteobacteria bacterium]
MAIVTRGELEQSLADLCTHVGDPRAGILGPRSLAWRLGGDLGVFIGGGRAALLQLAHPMVAHAIDHHSSTRTDVVGRFQRTFRHVFSMVFGPLDDALIAARRVHAIHARVHGEISEAIGGWPAGTRYHANDADALRWVHATLADTTIVVREHLDGALPIEIKDRYIVELNRFAALFGISPSLLPTSWADHAGYMREMIGGDRLAVSASAREMGQFLFGRGARAQPALGRVAEAISASLLPPHLADAFGLRAAPLRVRSGLGAFAAIYGRLPRQLVAIPAHADARNRIAGRGPSRWSAWTERQLFGLATRVAG